MNDPTARLSSNTPLPVTDKRLMDEGISEKLDLLCHIRKTPQVLYGMFVDLTRQFYANSDNLPIDACAVWDSDPSKTKLWIGTEYEWEDGAPEFRPAIYIKLDTLSYKSLTGRSDSQMRMDLEEGESQFTRNGTGIASWVHVATTKGEAAVLCGTTLDYLDAFSKVIRDDLCFQTFEVVSTNPMQVDKESRERWRSVVAVSYSFQDTWTLKTESPKLKRVVFIARQNMVSRGIV